ncbi:LPXTG-motif protein cell wall anchor domain protein [Catonella morbi ATCC 51271]|uniref:LPXTG-motif protein cell wall anchor domain protein n=1 Tax=Catonella morbi ATCC 51271 TaxID=592026 RepID=V2Y2B0_9FIRM|nr:leucine-rich repeat protein [Catonella morbi]ESL03088.1 LPXTG-motif protein cell wall anchor domain protein [Catonella morbi ATCC 51271]
MKKRIKTGHLVGGTAIALVAAVSISMTSVTFPQKSFPFGNVLSVQAAEPLLINEVADFDVQGNEVKGLTAAGNAKLNTPGHDSVILHFPATLPAIKIADNAFREKFTGKDVKLELSENIQEIGKCAFASNSAITSVTFGAPDAEKKLKKINEKAFFSSGLTGDLKLPEHLELLHEECFRHNKLNSVTLPDSLTTIYGMVFADNQISSVDFGSYANVDPRNGFGARRWDIDTALAGKMIAYGMFANNKLEKVEFPEGIWAIGSHAFMNNDIKEIKIPKNVTKIYKYAFKDNKNLTKLEFELDADGKGINQIDREAFNGCSITGKITFPKDMGEMGSRSFANNKITGVDFGPDAPLIGHYSFENNPIEKVSNLNSWGFEISPFRNTKALKNIEFEYANPKSGSRGTFGQSEDNTISPNAFKNGLLRSLNFPAYINVLKYDINGQKYNISSAFADNKGWTEGTNKVALYRLNADKTTYETNNRLDDGKFYVFNPVAVKFELKDQYGTVLPVTNIEVQRTRTVSDGSIQVTTHSALVTDTANFKLGDKIKFTLPNAPTGYEFATNPVTQSWLTKVTGSDNDYEVTLDPANTSIVSDVAYGDGYEVGYKQTVITLNYRNTNVGPVIPGPNPGNPTTPEPNLSPEQPSTPSVDVDSQNTPRGDANTDTTDVSDDTNPRGDANTDTTDISDDTSPRGNANTGKNVIADNKDEVDVNDTKAPLGKLPKTGGSNESRFILLGAALIGLGLVVKKKIR